MSITADACVEVVQSTLRDYDMLSGDEPLLVAVSGGPDSVCLLHILTECGLTVEAAHFNHQSRGEASDADAAFVERLADTMGLPFHTGASPIRDLSKDSPSSFEEVARDARYDFLFRTAKSSGHSVVATGHHADDQVETMIMRLLRGTAPSGLAGIPPRTERKGLRIIRPLIRLSREEILRYLHERGCPFRVDETNRDTRLLRNRLRYELIPQLRRQYNPKLREALSRLSESMNAENDYLAAMTESFLIDCLEDDGSIDRDAFREGHLALQRRAILTLAWEQGVNCDFPIVDGAVSFVAEGPTGNFFDLGGGAQLCNGRDTTTIGPSDSPAFDSTGGVSLAVPGETVAFGRRFTVRRLPGRPDESLQAYCSPTRQVFNGDSMTAPLTLRRRREGDRFTPFGMTGTKKLKDYFSDIGTPITRRAEEILVTNDREILWVVGHAVSATAAVTDAGQDLFEIEVTDEAQ